jgi:hypothetical protein
MAVRLFFASLIKDTFRVRLDTGGIDIKDLLAAKVRQGNSNIRVKPWQLMPIPIPKIKDLI